MTFGGSGLIREITFGGSGLIREMTFGGSGLIRIQTNTNNLNKTYALLLTTGDKDKHK